MSREALVNSKIVKINLFQTILSLFFTNIQYLSDYPENALLLIMY